MFGITFPYSWFFYNVCHKNDEKNDGLEEQDDGALLLEEQDDGKDDGNSPS